MARNKRFEAIVSMVDKTDVILDIGCDHGLVIKRILDLKLADKAIASELRLEPLNQAKKNLAGYNVSFVQGNGFENVSEDFNTVIIAGMGAHTIIDILSYKMPDATYILQANDKVHLLRTFIANNNFKIVDEIVVFDKFYYVILKIVRGNMELSVEDSYLGPILKNKKSSKEFYLSKINHLKEIVENVSDERRIEIEQLITIYESGLN